MTEFAEDDTRDDAEEPLVRQRLFAAKTHDFRVLDHDHMRTAVAAGARLRGKRVGQLCLMAGVGVAPANFAEGENRSISSSELLKWFDASGFALRLRPLDAPGDGTGDYEVSSVEELRSTIRKLVEASGNTVNAVADLSETGSAFARFAGPKGEHNNLTILMIFRVLEALQIQLWVIDKMKGRRAR